MEYIQLYNSIVKDEQSIVKDLIERGVVTFNCIFKSACSEKNIVEYIFGNINWKTVVDIDALDPSVVKDISLRNRPSSNNVTLGSQVIRNKIYVTVEIAGLAPEHHNKNPETLAVTCNSTKVLQTLTLLTKHQEFSDGTGENALYAALSMGKYDVVKALVKCGSSVNSLGCHIEGLPAGSTPMHVAVMSGNIDCVKGLINAGGFIDVTNDNLETPLMIAAERNDEDMVRAALICGAKATRADCNGKSALHKTTDGDCVDLLLETGIDQNTDLGSPDILYHLVVSNRSHLMKNFQEHGFDLNRPCCGSSKNSPLHLASIKGKSTVLQELLDLGADVSVVNAGKRSPLMLLSGQRLENCNETIETDLTALIEAGSNINQTEESGKSSLHIAVQSMNPRVVDTLIYHNANVNIQDTRKRTPLMYATMLSCADMIFGIRNDSETLMRIVYSLLQANCDVNALDCYKRNALLLAFPSFSVTQPKILYPVIKMLVLAGSKLPSKKETAQWTKLLAKIRSNSVRVSAESVESLVEITETMGWINSKRFELHTLQHMCRLKLRSTIGSDLRHKLDLLNTPQGLKPFILMEELKYVRDEGIARAKKEILYAEPPARQLWHPYA